jgi:hypothetical protein
MEFEKMAFVHFRQNRFHLELNNNLNIGFHIAYRKNLIIIINVLYFLHSFNENN